MIRRPPRSTRTDTLFPYTTLFRSGPERCAQVQAVAMDMNTAYDLEVRQHCPTARVVYDLFHVIAKYGREVISRVRVAAANQLRHDKPTRRGVQRAPWLLLSHPPKLKGREQGRGAEDGRGGK